MQLNRKASKKSLLAIQRISLDTAACDPALATLTSGIWLMASQLCWDACSLEQAQVSLHSVQLTTKSLHSPGVFAVLSLKVSTTADVITATVEIHDII